MPDHPDTLLQQLSRRIEAFINATGISQRKLAKLIKTDETHLANFLAGRTGLSAEKSLKLLQILNSTRSQLEAKFSRKPVDSRIIELQESGKPMRLDSIGGSVARQPGAPPDDGDITRSKSDGEPLDADIIDCLREVQNYHKTALKAIDDYLARAQQAKVNRGGSTESVHTYPTNNRSSKPGPKPNAFSKQEHLEWLKEQRRLTQELIQLERDTKREAELYWQERVELMKLKER